MAWNSIIHMIDSTIFWNITTFMTIKTKAPNTVFADFQSFSDQPTFYKFNGCLFWITACNFV